MAQGTGNRGAQGQERSHTRPSAVLTDFQTGQDHEVRYWAQVLAESEDVEREPTDRAGSAH